MDDSPPSNLLERRIPGHGQHLLVKGVHEPHRNPLRPRDDATDSVAADDHSTSSKWDAAKAIHAELKDLISVDYRSFLSGSSRAVMQAAHVLTAVSTRAKGNKALVEARKVAIEAHLNKFNFSINGTFTLDGFENRILLVVDEHVQWDLYGSFALVPHHTQMYAILGALQVANDAWDHICRALPPAQAIPNRIFSGSVRRALEVEVRWTVLLLRPYDFLPPDEVLCFATERALQGKSVFTLVHTDPANPTCPHLLGVDDEPVPAFTVPTLRQKTKLVSVFALLVNAFSKVNAAVARGSVHSDVSEAHELLHHALELIFYLPSRPAPLDSDVPMELSVESATPTVPSSLSGGGAAAASPTGVSGWIEGVAHGRMPDSDLPVPPEPVIAGFTNTEFDLLLARSKNPSASPGERLDAFMMLISGSDAAPYSDDDDTDSDATENEDYIPSDPDDCGDGRDEDNVERTDGL